MSEPADRRGDWAHGVDENLASLNAGQRSQDEKLQTLDASQDEIESTLHGVTDSGLIGRIEDLEDYVSRLNAVIFQDASGKKGLHHDIQVILESREDRRLGWANITKIVVAVITSGTLGLFWHDLRAYFMRKSTDPVEQMIEKVKHPKARNRHFTIQVDSDGQPVWDSSKNP